MPPIFGSWGLLNCWVYHLRSLALRMHEIVVHWFLCTDIVVFCAHVCWHAFNPELTKFEGLIMWILLKPSEVERFHGHHNFVDWKMKKIRKLNNQQVPLLGIKSAVVQYFLIFFCETTFLLCPSWISSQTPNSAAIPKTKGLNLGQFIEGTEGLDEKRYGSDVRACFEYTVC